jgi:hypothetical protein
LKDKPPAEQVRDVDKLVHDDYELRYNTLLVDAKQRHPRQVSQSQPQPSLWRSDVKIRAELENYTGRGRGSKEGRIVYRIQVWLEYKSALNHVNWIDYDFHPEYGGVSRRARWMQAQPEGRPFRTWVNTWDDFWIRVRCSDGTEFGGWLSDALLDTAVGASVEHCVQSLRCAAGEMRGDPTYFEKPLSSYFDLPLDCQTR